MATSPTHSEPDHSSDDNGAHRLLRVRTAPQLTHPDSEDNVVQQSEQVFFNYVYQSYRNDSVRAEVDSTPPAPELNCFSTAPIT